jgi:hypothetical protein
LAICNCVEVDADELLCSFFSITRTLFSISAAVNVMFEIIGSALILATSFGYHLYGIQLLFDAFAAIALLATASMIFLSTSLF